MLAMNCYVGMLANYHWYPDRLGNDWDKRT